MKRLAQYFSLTILYISFSLIATAQGFRVETKSPPAATGAETFTSMEGRFSVALPKRVMGYNPQSANTPQGRVEGTMFTWKTAEGEFMVSYIDRPEPLESMSKQVLDFLRDNYLASSKGQAKLIKETDISLDGHPGRESWFEYPDNLVLSRLYLVRNRLYQATALYKKAQEPAIIKILSSFKLLSQADVDAEIQKRVAEATPSPLPQQPVTKKLKSDAADEGLKGKVKTIFKENESLDGTWAVSRRKPSSMEYYNEQGNIYKKVSYDYRGNPADIWVYGYLDGERVAKFKSIDYEYNPPPMMMPATPGQPKPKYDPRYSLKYQYKYDDKGNLSEEILYGSNGEPSTRILYSLKGNQKEALYYSKDGSLERKYVYTIDDKGNEIEETAYGGKDNSIRYKYAYAYDFDAQGNWIKRTTSKLVTKDGKSVSEPGSVTYRTISYY